MKIGSLPKALRLLQGGDKSKQRAKVSWQKLVTERKTQPERSWVFVFLGNRGPSGRGGRRKRVLTFLTKGVSCCYMVTEI